MTGQTVAHYRMLEKLGEGGMGVVYKARDTHLDRFVAIKVLPPERVASPERKARFVQEAKAASALNHPNIITIYDISADAGRDFIAMEYVAGKTLDQLIARKGMRLSEALKIAVQIADALSRAHAAGIIHRDLKPANIMVDEHGLVKVLDFGLAKLTERHSDESAPTETLKPRTEEGVVVGTAGYMSPEQVEGKPLDARSDIFSFGAVLYEMVTGRRAFRGDSKMATMSAILREEPAPVQDVPPELEKLITRCLRKDPERRAQHMDDVKLALQELKEESESGKLAPPTALPKPRRWAALKAAGVILAVAAGAGVALWFYRSESPPAQAPLMRLTSDSGLTTDPALSPDGRLIAYASDRAGGDNLDIWVQQVDRGGNPLRLTTDPADESEPTFSPDGTQIAFRSERDGGGIYAIPALGGEPRLIVKGGRQPRFSVDGSRIAYILGQGGVGGVTRGQLFVASSTGEGPRRLAIGGLGASGPAWSPDGKQILFATGLHRPDDWAIVSPDPSSRASPVVLRLGELKKKEKLADLLPHYWIAGNHVVFSAKSGDSAHVFEIGLSPPGLISQGWRLGGSSRRLTSGTELEEMPALAVGRSVGGGRRLAFASRVRSENLWSLALDTNHPGTGGKLQRLTQESGFLNLPWVSEDGTKVAYVTHTAYNDQVWLMDLKSGRRFLLSSETSRKIKPIIHADGSRLLYSEEIGLYAVPTSGGARQKLCEDCQMAWDWSRDSKRILHYHATKDSVACRMVNLDTGAGHVFMALAGRALIDFRWSPDGRWIVFCVPQVDRTQVYVAAFTGDQGPGQDTWIPITDGSAVDFKMNWSPDGNSIYAVSNRDGFDCVWAYPLDPRTKRPAGKPLAVFHSHGSRLSMRNANPVSVSLSVVKDRIVFNQGEVTGNIWMTEFNPD